MSSKGSYSDETSDLDNKKGENTIPTESSAATAIGATEEKRKEGTGTEKA